MNTKSFNKRKVVTLILLATLIIMPVSGAIVHIAHGTENSHTWLHIHVLFGIIFIVASVYHIVFNWKALKHYLLGKKQGL